MSILFISDLHLEPKRPTITRVFIDFLQNQATHAEELYILGDFFEVWVGDDDVSNFNEEIVSLLKKLTSAGLPIYIMHGNRDFLLSQEFMRRTGCQLLSDPTVIDLYGQPTLLTHGDSLCIDDIAYLKFRNKVRNPFNQRLFLGLPLSIRKAIARLFRTLSQRRAYQNNFSFIDANFDEIKRSMAENNVQLIIHGHTHLPSIQFFKLQGKDACRIVLSDWETFGNVLICESNGEKRLINILAKE